MIEDYEKEDNFKEKQEDIEENTQNVEDCVKKQRNNSNKVLPMQRQVKYINSNNEIIDNLHLRISKIEYELMFIKDKLFTSSMEKGKEKLSSYGKEVKQKILRSTL